MEASEGVGHVVCIEYSVHRFYAKRPILWRSRAGAQVSMVKGPAGGVVGIKEEEIVDPRFVCRQAALESGVEIRLLSVGVVVRMCTYDDSCATVNGTLNH